MENIKKMTEFVNHGLGFSLLRTEWDFTQWDEDKPAAVSRFEYAVALQKTLDAADALGSIEHTCDWDPIIMIDMRDGTRLESSSHYYQLVDVQEEFIKIETPDKEALEDVYSGDMDMEIYKFYDAEEGVITIPMEKIKSITIDPQ